MGTGGGRIGIEHFALFADDAPALRRFYERVFGMRTIVENPGPPPGYFLSDGAGGTIEIIGRPEGVRAPEGGQRWVCHVAFAVEDVAAKRAELEAEGFVFEKETAVDSEEMQTCFFLDPAGNRAQLVRRRRPLGSE